jgi:hypothetical protein
MTQDELVALALSKLPAKRALPCKSYVVLVLSADKWDILDPEVIGPFDSYRQAYEWIARLPNASIAATDQKYPGHIKLAPCPPSTPENVCGWAIVSEQTAADPSRFMQEWTTYIQPNAETIAAMEAAERGEFTHTFSSPAELMADLNAPEPPVDMFQFTSLFPTSTNLPCTIYVSVHGFVTIDPTATNPPEVKQWIELNRDALLAHWRGELDSVEMVRHSKKLPLGN